MNMKSATKAFSSIALVTALSLALVYASAQGRATKHAAALPEASEATQSAATQIYQELLELSQQENRGLTFFVNGQTIPGVVRKILADDAVEVRNRTYDRIIIPLERIDALAIS